MLSLIDCKRQLCRRSRQVVPDHFKRVLTEGERSLGLLGNRKKFDWDSIVKFAESEDRHQRKRREDMSSDHLEMSPHYVEAPLIKVVLLVATSPLVVFFSSRGGSLFVGTFPSRGRRVFSVL